VTYEAADRITLPAKPLPRLVDKRFIMYVGRALPHKNLVRLFRGFELLKKKHPELLLVFVGKYDDNYHRLSAIVTERRMADSVVFTDFVTDAELKWLYENTAAYVFPSLSEGFGLPPLEAMVHGAPVVSSKATCLPEINGQAAHYFDPRNVRDMAIKINDVLVNNRLKITLVNNGRRQAAKYSWRKMAAETLKIYDKALNKNT
jgi:glycosyltransferase involved in cell wall biosynthesis